MPTPFHAPMDDATVLILGSRYQRGHLQNLTYPATRITLADLRLAVRARCFDVIEYCSNHVIVSTTPYRDGVVEICEFWYVACDDPDYLDRSSE